MPFYKKKPVVIEAVKYDGKNGGILAHWVGGREHFEPKASDHTDVYQYLEIPTLEGNMRAAVGDYIIKGVQGEFYPCKPDIFEETYGRVDDE